MAVSKRLRYEILRRDNHACRYCGATAPDVPLRVDHVTPVALGGTDTPDNLVTSCEPCNSGKSSASPDAHHVAAVSDDALRWADAMKQAADNLLELEKPKGEYREAFLAEWNRWHVGKDEAKKIELPVDWKPTIERFRVAGIPAWMWADIVDVGMANEKVKPESTFRYCCGVAWNKVTQLQAEARRVISPTVPAQELSPLPAALSTAAIEVWCFETGEDPTSEQEVELRAGVVDAVRAGADPDEIIKAAKHAGWKSHSSIPEGLADIQAEARYMGTLTVWERAWQASSHSRPSAEEFQTFTENCSALAETAVATEQMHLAATFAGAHLTPHLYLGIDVEILGSVEAKWVRQRAVDFWSSACAATSQAWPSAEQREALSRSVDQLNVDGGFSVFDVWGAAVAAGAYEDTDLSTVMTRNLSVFEIASRPMAGGVN
jgi:hypothetical protein